MIKTSKKKANLVIVESPTKAKTIGKFLGNQYEVLSSYGHVRDLPKSKLGVDVEHDFQPQYVIPTRVRKNVNVLKKEAGKAERIILATDEDREGEAIAWHLTKALGLDAEQSKKVERIVFHEITERAIKEALENPRKIDTNLVNAQQARRVLDRLVGYLLSPFLWKKVFRGLSAGRVQSAALRIIVKREEEIKDFKPQEYWSVEAVVFPDERKKDEFSVFLHKIDDETLEKLAVGDKDSVQKIVDDLEGASYRISKIEKKQTKRNSPAPFTTSTLQQEANKKLRYSAKQTMRFAQGLYENGLITYMRTDSTNLSAESMTQAKKWLIENLGENYALHTDRIFKNKSRLAQEAHEAIRPTSPFNDPKNLTLATQEKKLYELIWRRFLASQMPEALFDATTIEVAAHGRKKYGLKANGIILKFDGFLKIWPTKFVEKELPKLSDDENLTLVRVASEQHFTEPPPRYNEASLIKALEEYGIGRPSTYAPTISVIQERNYIEKDDARRLRPTETGVTVDSLLKENFPEIVDIGFTAQMEEKFDKIADGDDTWNETIKAFYGPFKALLDVKYDEVSKIEVDKKEEATDEKCDKCGKSMIIKIGRFGKFIACSGFPDCKNTKKLLTTQNSFGPCPECKEGTVISRRTKTRRTFYGCSRYPECKHASWTRPGMIKENAADDNASSA